MMVACYGSHGSFSGSTCHQIFHVLPGTFLGPPVYFGLGPETVKSKKKENRVTLQLYNYRGADKSLPRPTFRCISFDGENISFDASLVVYISSSNILPIMIINNIYEHQNLLSL
jgi:hypothetical protein